MPAKHWWVLPGAKTLESSIYRIYIYIYIYIDIILRAGTSIYASSGFGPLGPKPFGDKNRITKYFIVKVIGRSNEHMFRFTGVDLKFILYHPFNLRMFSSSIFTLSTRSARSLEDA